MHPVGPLKSSDERGMPIRDDRVAAADQSQK